MGFEVIDGKQTCWEGLWYQPENHRFASSVLDLSELRKFKGKVRLIIRKNKFYNNGENKRPNYNFCLRDAGSESFSKIKVTLDDYRKLDDYELEDILKIVFEDMDEYEIAGIIEEATGIRLYTYDEAQRAVDGATRSALSGYTDNLVEDYV